jgi:hypothetical protein
MNPEEFKSKMQELANKYKDDPMYFHSYADELIIELLFKIGYKDGAIIFDKETKWYE